MGGGWGQAGLTSQEIKDRLAELNPEACLADGFDDALLGVAQQFNRFLAVYSTKKCLEILAADMPGSPEERHEAAAEYFEFNVTGAWVGEDTPLFLLDDDEVE